MPSLPDELVDAVKANPGQTDRERFDADFDSGVVYEAVKQPSRCARRRN